jgi:hypothetical protein
MESDNIENFSIFLNSQASQSGATILQGTAGEVLFKINTFASLPQKFRRTRYKASITFISSIVPGTTFDFVSHVHYVEIIIGSQVFNMYGVRTNNAITLSLEPMVVSGPSGVLTTTSSAYLKCESNLTTYLPSDQIIVRVRNSNNDTIATSFPHYCLQISFTPIIHPEFN